MRRRQFGNMPTAMITGSNGKTTTSRMLARILTHVGYNVGLATTDNIVIDGKVVVKGDWAGYRGHHVALSDPSTTAAVLETARGGLLTHGLYIDQCDVAALLNIGRDHVGSDGIQTMEQMAAHKRQVIEAAQKTIVLNADDSLCRQFIEEFPISRTTIFAYDANSEAVKRHIEMGGVAYCLYEKGEPHIIRLKGENRQRVIPIADLPSAVGGLIRHNIANAMAAAALAEGLDISMEAIREGLGSFQMNLEHSPGRFNIIDGYPFHMILDRASHIDSATALVKCLDQIDVRGRRLCMCTALGDRPAWQYSELSAILANHFDHFVCYERPEFLYGRVEGEVIELLRSGLIAGGTEEHEIDAATDYEDGLAQMAALAKPGDLIAILFSPEQDGAIPLVDKAFRGHAIAIRDRARLAAKDHRSSCLETVNSMS
ncbi:MAG: Mur ligase family protein [Hyphomicrobiaceae bacterium]